MKTRKTITLPIAAALAFSLLLTSPASAGTLKIPKGKAAVSVNVPDSWEPEPNEKGFMCESPDKVVTAMFEVTPAKGLDALIEENVEWLQEQKVNIDKDSEKKGDYEAAGVSWKRISWDGKSKEWGESVVGFMFTDAGNGKVLTVTYWVTKKDFDKDAPALEEIFESVKVIGGK